jgi:lysophospholipase L1-like esterase
MQTSNNCKLIALAGLLLAFAGAQQSTYAADGHWVTTWGCGPQKTENSASQNNLPPATLAYSTLRQFVHTTIGGQHLRLRFSNAYGTNLVVIQSAHIALAAGTGSSANGVVNPATDTALTFRGAPSINIPPGEVVLSDPVAFSLPALTNLAISIYYGYVSPNILDVGTITGHPGSRTTSYIIGSNVVSAVSMAGAATTKHWYTISGVDVLGDSFNRTVVTLGDSITDGRGSTDDANNRWPDNLAQRLITNTPTAGVAVVNMGIGGGAVLSGGLGPTALARFDRDVLNQSGVRYLIVFEGVNDIGSASSSMTTATNLVAAYTEFANKAHARNILAYGATITPFGGNGYYSTLHEQERQFVNAWFRTNTIYDGLIDFDVIVRDPVTLTNIQAAYYSGVNASDGLHLNPAGYKAMADAIDLNLFAP